MADATGGCRVEYMVFGGTFHTLANGARRFGDSPYGDTFERFEDAYDSYNGIDITEEHRLMSQSCLFGCMSTYKRLDRVEFRDDDPTVVDVIMFECYDGTEVSHD